MFLSSIHCQRPKIAHLPSALGHTDDAVSLPLQDALHVRIQLLQFEGHFWDETHVHHACAVVILTSADICYLQCCCDQLQQGIPATPVRSQGVSAATLLVRIHHCKVFRLLHTFVANMNCTGIMHTSTTPAQDSKLRF